MLKRVFDTRVHNYKNYGGRGVTICTNWLCFMNFLNDAKELPNYNFKKICRGELVLDKDTRQVGLKCYSPDTCQWITKLSNAKARDTSKYRKHLDIYKDGKLVGVDVSKTKASEILGITTQVLSTAYKHGITYKGILVKDHPLKKV